MRDIVPEWCATFVDGMQRETLFEVVKVRPRRARAAPAPPHAPRQAANYMDVKALMDLTCAKIATLVRDSTPEEIRREFCIPDESEGDGEGEEAAPGGAARTRATMTTLLEEEEEEEERSWAEEV